MPDPVISYTWEVEQLDVAPAIGALTDVVHKVHWRLHATDGHGTISFYGDVPLAPAEQSAFVPFDTLSEAKVIEWLEAAIDARAGALSDDDSSEPTVAQLKAQQAGALHAMRSPATTARPLPWLAA